jgi:hypothetical protein
MEAFLSHSKADQELVNRFYKVCSRAEMKPNIAEFEELGTGSLTAEDIVQMIQKSSLFLLFLTPNIMNSVYTQNWVNFELGCAYGARTRPPAEQKDIYVFEPFDQLQFPIPYLDYYLLFDPRQEVHWRFIENMFCEEKIYWSRLFPLLWGQRPSDQFGTRMTCDYCHTTFTLLSKVDSFLCPTCRRESVLNPVT